MRGRSRRDGLVAKWKGWGRSGGGKGVGGGSVAWKGAVWESVTSRLRSPVHLHADHSPLGSSQMLVDTALERAEAELSDALSMSIWKPHSGK